MLQHLMHVLQVLSGLQGFVCGGHALRGAQDCRASWGPRVARAHTSGLCGGHALRGAHSHIILALQGEIGRLSGARRCESRRHTNLTTWLWLAVSASLRTCP